MEYLGGFMFFDQIKIFVIVVGFISQACASQPSHANNNQFEKNVETVNQVDLNRYQGQWFELAAIPQSFQKNCVKNTMAEHTLEPSTGYMIVKNSCTESDGKIKIAEGRARVEDQQTNAKLKVTFVKLINWVFTFGGNYWILGLENNYQWVVVGEPSRQYAWILARTKNISYTELEKAKVILKDNGYDTCALLTSIQDSGLFQDRKKLCDVIK